MRVITHSYSDVLELELVPLKEKDKGRKLHLSREGVQLVQVYLEEKGIDPSEYIDYVDRVVYVRKKKILADHHLPRAVRLRIICEKQPEICRFIEEVYGMTRTPKIIRRVLKDFKRARKYGWENTLYERSRNKRLRTA